MENKSLLQKQESILNEYNLSNIKKEIKEKIELDKVRFSACCSDSTASL